MDNMGFPEAESDDPLKTVCDACGTILQMTWTVTLSAGDLKAKQKQWRASMSEMERRVRERRKEILMAGNGSDDFMDEDEAEGIAYRESLEDIYWMDGGHLADTDPDLAEWLEQTVEKESDHESDEPRIN
jgi:hypothetical protein